MPKKVGNPLTRPTKEPAAPHAINPEKLQLKGPARNDQLRSEVTSLLSLFGVGARIRAAFPRYEGKERLALAPVVEGKVRSRSPKVVEGGALNKDRTEGRFN